MTKEDKELEELIDNALKDKKCCYENCEGKATGILGKNNDGTLRVLCQHHSLIEFFKAE